MAEIVKSCMKINKNWQFNMAKCPDCNTIQTTIKDVGTHCDNPMCASVVQEYTRKDNNFGKLIWQNENWD